MNGFQRLETSLGDIERFFVHRYPLRWLPDSIPRVRSGYFWHIKFLPGLRDCKRQVWDRPDCADAIESPRNISGARIIAPRLLSVVL